MFAFVSFMYLQVGPRTTLISTLYRVNISFLTESEVRLFDRAHVVLKQEEKVKLLKMR